jgi:hypothetical protein
MSEFNPRDCIKCGATGFEVNITFKEKFFFDKEASKGSVSQYLETWFVGRGCYSTPILEVEDAWLRVPDLRSVDKLIQSRALTSYDSYSYYNHALEEEILSYDMFDGLRVQVFLTLPVEFYQPAFLGTQEYFDCECSRCKFKWTEYPNEPNLYNKEIAERWAAYNNDLDRVFMAKKLALLENHASRESMQPTAAAKKQSVWDLLWNGPRK